MKKIFGALLASLAVFGFAFSAFAETPFPNFVNVDLSSPALSAGGIQVITLNPYHNVH